MGWVSCQEDADKRDRISYQKDRVYISPGFKSIKSKYEHKTYTANDQQKINHKTNKIDKTKKPKPNLKPKPRRVRDSKGNIYIL